MSSPSPTDKVKNSSFAQNGSFLGTGSFGRKGGSPYGQSFRTGKERRIGVAKTAAMSDFRMSADADQDEDGSVSVKSFNPPSPVPNQGGDELDVTVGLMAHSTAEYSDIDLSSQAAHSVVSRKGGRRDYGSFEASAVRSSFPGGGKFDDISDVGTTARRISSRFSNPWTGAFESAIFSYFIIQGTSVATGDLNETALSAIASLAAVSGYGFYVSFGVFLEAARNEKWVPPHELIEGFMHDGWSPESIEAYTNDIRPKVVRPTICDVLWTSLVHLLGALLPTMPVIIGELAGWRLVPTIVTSASLTLCYCTLIRSYQVSCAPQRPFTIATALYSIVAVVLISCVLVCAGVMFREVI